MRDSNPTSQVRRRVETVMYGGNPVLARLRPLAGTVVYGRQPDERDYECPIRRDSRGNDVIRETLASGAPCLVTRLGDVELRTISYYMKWRRPRIPVNPAYPPRQSQTMRINTGFFPVEDSSLDRFARMNLEAVSQADVLGVWFNRHEHRVVSECCSEANLVELAALNCMCWEGPWSSALEGKTVLVIHPFANSIESQYRNNRRAIFADPTVLPEFELKTMVPVQSIAGNDCSYATWFDALQGMCEEISRKDFDVAIIGAGAYGLPLGAFIKSLGRQAVHMGGATQLLFGIKGRRWEDEYQDSIVPLFNDAWVRPLPEETPPGAETVERGCYW